jgi:hypothetical protein
MMKSTFTLTFLLAAAGGLMAQPATPAGTSSAGQPSTVVYTQTSAVDLFLAANSGASLHQVASDGLTFKLPDGSYRFVSVRGLTHQENDRWVPSKTQVAALSDGTGWVFGGIGYAAQLVQGKGADKELRIGSGSTMLSIHTPGLVYNSGCLECRWSGQSVSTARVGNKSFRRSTIIRWQRKIGRSHRYAGTPHHARQRAGVSPFCLGVLELHKWKITRSSWQES